MEKIWKEKAQSCPKVFVKSLCFFKAVWIILADNFPSECMTLFIKIADLWISQAKERPLVRLDTVVLVYPVI